MKVGGGSWELLEDRFLVGAGNTYTLGDEGGSATHYHRTSNGTAGGNTIYQSLDRQDEYGSEVITGRLNYGSATYTSNASMRLSNTETVSSLPPYLAVFMWKRVS